MIALGEDSWKPVFDILQTLSHGPFPIPDFALYPFTIINYSYEHDYILSPVRPPSKSSNLGVVTHQMLGIMWYKPQLLYIIGGNINHLTILGDHLAISTKAKTYFYHMAKIILLLEIYPKENECLCSPKDT